METTSIVKKESRQRERAALMASGARGCRTWPKNSVRRVRFPKACFLLRTRRQDTFLANVGRDLVRSALGWSRSPPVARALFSCQAALGTSPLQTIGTAFSACLPVPANSACRVYVSRSDDELGRPFESSPGMLGAVARFNGALNAAKGKQSPRDSVSALWVPSRNCCATSWRSA